MTNKQILFIVEGEVEEGKVLAKIAKQLLCLNKSDYYVYPFNSAIYELYDAYMNQEYDNIVDYLAYKKGLEITNGLKPREMFAAIYLVFDFEPHYHKYSNNKIKEMLNFFNDETRNGKLYINYPMVESFYHLKEENDESYNDLIVTINKDFNGEYYKKLVNEKMYFRKNKVDKRICKNILLHNFKKCCYLLNKNLFGKEIDYQSILDIQICKKNNESKIYVLNTFVLMSYDYNNDVIKE